MKDFLDVLKALWVGIIIGLNWGVMNIKREKKLYMKLIYIIILILDIILAPIKLIIVAILMKFSKSFSDGAEEIFDDMCDELEESEL